MLEGANNVKVRGAQCLGGTHADKEGDLSILCAALDKRVYYASSKVRNQDEWC